MGTTNILDLNNRLEKVEKKNVAQNSYTSLKNKPKINNVTLTGNKTLADIGAAAAADLTTLAGDVGDKTQLNTVDKSSTVAAINELNSGLANLHIWANNVEQYGKYLNDHGEYTNYDQYCVVKIPVRGGYSYIVENAAPNASVYSKFLDVDGNQVGDLIQQTVAPLRLAAPAGAVSVLVNMFVNFGYPQVRLITN